MTDFCLTPAQPMTNPVDFHNLAAQCRHGLPSTWQWRQIASLDGGFFQLTGASPVGTYQRGPRKGQPKFPATPNYRQVIITAVDVAEARSRWERETGQCSWCGGTGRRLHGSAPGRAPHTGRVGPVGARARRRTDPPI